MDTVRPTSQQGYRRRIDIPAKRTGEVAVLGPFKDHVDGAAVDDGSDALAGIESVKYPGLKCVDHSSRKLG